MIASIHLDSGTDDGDEYQTNVAQTWHTKCHHQQLAYNLICVSRVKAFCFDRSTVGYFVNFFGVTSAIVSKCDCQQTEQTSAAEYLFSATESCVAVCFDDGVSLKHFKS